MLHVQHIYALDTILSILAVWVAAKLYKLRIGRWHGTQTTDLGGPASRSIMFGLHRYIDESEDSGALYQQWAQEHGCVYKVPGGLGSYKIVICDPKANAHFYAKDTFTYGHTSLGRILIENLIGRGLLWSEGESHRRQRKALSPAFSNAAIRRLTSVFYDSSYKMKANWDSILASGSEDVLIDVQEWMNHISLDSIGIAGFGHDFGTLDGKYASVAEVFEVVGIANATVISRIVSLMGPVLPLLIKLPTAENKLFRRLRVTMSAIADELLSRTRTEKDGKMSREKAEKSVIGLLIKAESSDAELRMSQEEVLAQNLLLLAGYETTSISLTWALIELSKDLSKQQKLREELAVFGPSDPTWEQLSAGLPYLDSVVHEVLRLHPPVTETIRVAKEDDVIPLSTPVVTRTGETVSSIVIAKGTTVSVPIRCMNRSEAFWGPDAKAFVPERWLGGAGKGIEEGAKAILGHRDILTFSDGPRTCLGRGFALAEFKAALSVLIRYYEFELPDGPETKILTHKSILPRPKIEGQDGPKMPLKVRRVE